MGVLNLDLDDTIGHYSSQEILGVDAWAQSEGKLAELGASVGFLVEA